MDRLRGIDSRIEPDPQPSTGEQCPACRRRVSRFAAFCGRCGATLATSSAPQGPVVAPMAGIAHRCPRCGAGRVGTDRYCSACGVDCWALAAGSAPSWSAAAVATSDAPRTTGSVRAALAGRRLRIGVGLVVAMFLAVNALAGPGDDTSGGPLAGGDTAEGSDRPGQVVAGATGPARAPDASPTVTAGDPATTPDATAQQPSEPGAPPPAATQSPAQTPAPAPVPPPAPVVLEGSGSAVTDPFDYAGGNVRVLSRVTAASGGCAYIGTFSATDPANLPSDPSLRTAVVFLEGSGTAEGWVDLALPAGQYFLMIESDCSWTVTISPT